MINLEEFLGYLEAKGEKTMECDIEKERDGEREAEREREGGRNEKDSGVDRVLTPASIPVHKSVSNSPPPLPTQVSAMRLLPSLPPASAFSCIRRAHLPFKGQNIVLYRV